MIIAFFLASIGLNGILAVFAAFFKTDRLTDISYALSFLAILLMMVVSAGQSGGMSPQLWVGILCVALWAVRLGAFLFIRINKMGRDRRFDGIRENPARFLAFWVLQAISVWIILLPLEIMFISGGSAPPGIISATGWTLFCAGLLIEIVSDVQKSAFKARKDRQKDWMDSGLWKYSRHPNYLGEILLWWGISLPAFELLKGRELLAFTGPVFLTLLLIQVSGIPPLERLWVDRYGSDPDFQEYMRRTSKLIPLPKCRK